MSDFIDQFPLNRLVAVGQGVRGCSRGKQNNIFRDQLFQFKD